MNRISTPAGLALLLLAAGLAPAPPLFADEPTCEATADCNQKGTAAYKAKKYQEAIGLFGDQLAYAEEAEDPKQQLVALNNLALANLKKGEALEARAWLHLATEIDPADKATLFNRGEVDKAIAALPARPPIGGEYVAYAGAGQWQTVEIAAKGKDRYSIKIFAMRLGNSWREWGPAGIGELEDEITVKNGQAKFKKKFEFADEPCEIDFKFAGDEMEVDQATPDYLCGFGNGVAATGQYFRIGAAATP